ncbi:hypothetical protein GGI23_002627 [Coemansia sp. RSA 2559]|nr:hypothetical protein GGI23_002627 [Coemansia sp. RSA 2559]
MENGEAMDVTVDVEMSDAEEHKPKSKTPHKRPSRGRRVVSFGRSASAASENVRWRFSARFEPLSDDGKDSSSESDDDDREAIASKVPVAKIRGGELIGLSLRPTTSSASSGSIPAAPTVRSTGFGGTRTPIPIDGEAEKTAKVAPKLAASVLPAAEPDSTASLTQPDSAATTTAIPGLTGSSLFGTLAAQSPKGTEDSKQEAGHQEAKTATGFVPSSVAASSATTKPVFSFGKPAESTDEPKSLSTSASESKPAPPALFSFGKKSDSSTPEESSKGAETPSKPAVAFSFGSKADDSSTGVAEGSGKALDSGKKDADADATSTDAAKVGGTLPKFSFSLGTSSAKDGTASAAKEPAPPFAFKGASTTGSNEGSSFGLKTTSKPETESAPAPTTSASESTPKPVFGFAFNPSGTASAPGADKKEESKDKPAFSIFGGSSGKDEPPAKDASKSGEGTGSTSAGRFGTGSTSIFGAPKMPESSKRPADDKPEGGSESEAKSTPFGFKSPGNFLFGKPAEAGAASSGPKFTFGTGSTNSTAASTTNLSSFAVAAPVKTVDLTSSVAITSAAITAAPTTAGSSAPTPNVFSGFGKPAVALATSAAEISGSAMDSAMTDEEPKAASSSSGFGGLTAKQPFGGFGAAGSTATAPFGKPPAFGSLTQQNPSSGGDQSTKKFAFSFGTANTPSAASFEATNVPTPAVTSFGPAAAPTASTAHSFGAPAATPSAFNFGAASSPAVTPSATPATSAFSFGASNPMSKPPQSNMFGAAQASKPNNAFGSASSQGMANNTSTSRFGGGFGSASASATNNGFGSSSALGFGSSMSGNGSGARVPSNGGFNFSSNASNTSGFGGGGQPSGAFGQQSNVSTASAFTSQPSGGFGASAGNSGFGAGSNVSAFGTGAPPSTAGSSAPQFSFGQNTGASTGSFQFNSGGSNAFDGNSSVANSTPTTPFTFASNTSLQGGSGSFQFTAGSNQQSSTGVGSGMTLGRVAGGSNVSTSSHGGRRIARARPRRAL